MRRGLRGRLGLQTTGDEPGVLAIVRDVRDLRFIDPIADEFDRVGARAGFTVCRLDGRGILQPPWPVPGAASAFLAGLKIRAVLIAGDRCRIPQNLAKALAKRATPVAWLAPDTGAAPPTGLVLDAVYYPKRDSVQQVAQSLLALVGRERKWRARGDFQLLRHIAGTAAQAMDATPRPWWVRRLATRIDSVDDLRARLGRPATILCLGNGPSSEEPAVLSENHDALFRANHSWLKRGTLCRPQLVFTGLKATMRELSGPIFGLHGEETEKVLLLTRLMRPWRNPVAYFVADSIADPYPEFRWGDHRPTSGATMIATAVSLVPKRLVIAGIDMFSSRAGAYPGDSTAANAYAPAHDRDKELAYLLGCLDRHLGELEIHGDVLRDAVDWRRRRGI